MVSKLSQHIKTVAATENNIQIHCKELIEQMNIVVIGLGYVGLPLAVQLAKHFDVWGLDINAGRVEELRNGFDRTNEIDKDRLTASTLQFCTEPSACPAADAYIVTVPTPIDSNNKPDLTPVISASKMVAKMLDPTKQPVIIYESTVYPGVTEDICAKLLEEGSGLKQSKDFYLGYSPERINPGDREHTVDKITKVIAGEDDATTLRLADIYGKVTSGGVFRAASIKAAEAAKVIENAQRDINIAFMNEVTQIFAKMDLSIWDVLAAANTKWNFLPFQPGLVGGHCIGVDPYYLSHRAQELGHDPEVILAGRKTNDGMGAWVANAIHERRSGKAGTVLVLGLTFKEDVPDLRNSKVGDVIAELKALGHKVSAYDPMANPDEALAECGIEIVDANLSQSYDVVFCAVAHKSFVSMRQHQIEKLVNGDGLVFDLKGIWREQFKNEPKTGAAWRYFSL
jgi:UDP-N-acetyl-D-glucosamine/UDP-N-acetyl-D-galactosamine dehydrogenase